MADPVSAANVATASVTFFMSISPLFMIAFVAITTALQVFGGLPRPGPSRPTPRAR